MKITGNKLSGIKGKLVLGIMKITGNKMSGIKVTLDTERSMSKN